MMCPVSVSQRTDKAIDWGRGLGGGGERDNVKVQNNKMGGGGGGG